MPPRSVENIYLFAHSFPQRKAGLVEIGTSVVLPPGLTSVKLRDTVWAVKIRNFMHKGLKRVYAEDNGKGVPPDTVDKLRKMLAFLDVAIPTMSNSIPI